MASAEFLSERVCVCESDEIHFIPEVCMCELKE